MADWKSVVASVAPTIATALGGPFAGLAVSAIGEALGIGNDQGKISAAITGASAETLLQLKQADVAFKQRIAELGVDLEKIAAEDRNSARARETNVRDSTPKILAFIIVAGWVIVQYYLLSHIVPSEMRDIIMRMLGVLDMALGAVLNYYFGSSSSSAKKTEILASTVK